MISKFPYTTVEEVVDVVITISILRLEVLIYNVFVVFKFNVSQICAKIILVNIGHTLHNVPDLLHPYARMWETKLLFIPLKVILEYEQYFPKTPRTRFITPINQFFKCVEIKEQTITFSKQETTTSRFSRIPCYNGAQGAPWRLRHFISFRFLLMV